MKKLALSLLSLTFAENLYAEAIVYQGTAEPGVGKHIVFLASDHEYRSEELSPALARILAKHHGFTCTVVFGTDENDHTKADLNIDFVAPTSRPGFPSAGRHRA